MNGQVVCNLISRVWRETDGRSTDATSSGQVHLGCLQQLGGCLLVTSDIWVLIILLSAETTWTPLPSVQFSSVIQSCPTLCVLMDGSMPGFPVHHQLPELAQTHVHQVGDAIQPFIFCHPLLLLPSIFPSIRVFSNESVLCIKWPKYWSFSSSISPSKEYSGLISFRMDWFDLLAVQGTLKSLLQHYSSKSLILWFSKSLILSLWLQILETSGDSCFQSSIFSFKWTAIPSHLCSLLQVVFLTQG